MLESFSNQLHTSPKVQNHLVLSTALRTASALIFILSGWSGTRTSSVEGADLGWFCFNSFKVVSVRVSIQLCILLVLSLIALSTLPLCICSTNFFESCVVVLGALTSLRLLCIVPPSFRRSAKCLSAHNWSLLSRALVWSL